MASDDLDSEAKAADISGMYLNPPQHAAVFCVDETTAIQALDRLDPVLPLSADRAERHEFEYYRHAFPVCRAGHRDRTRSRENRCPSHQPGLRRFPEGSCLYVSAHPQIHIILDNLSAHITVLVREFLGQNSRVRFHFTPTHSSLLAAFAVTISLRQATSVDA